MIRALLSLLLMIVCAGAQTITGAGPAVPVQAYLAGYNNQSAGMREPWNSETRRQAWINARPSVIRYPGGTVSTYWDMRNDRLFRAGTALDVAQDVVLQRKYVIGWVASMNGGAPNPLEDLKRLLDGADENSPVGAPAVVFVLNMATPGADYYSLLWDRAVDQTPGSDDWWAMMDDRFRRNTDMLDRAVALGIPVRYVEFGNEYYFGQGAANPDGAVVEPYVAGVTPNDSSMIGAFPGDGRDYACAVNSWARKLRTRYLGVRLCAIAGDGRGGGRRRDWNLNVTRYVDRELVPAVSFHHYGGITRGSLTSSEGIDEAIASWTESWDEVLRSADELRDREFWISEWNSNVAPGTWGHGLQALSALHRWLTGGNLGIAAYHQFSANSVMLRSGPEITAAARAYSLFSLAARGRVRAQELRWDKDLPGLTGWKFTRADSTGARYFVVNRSSDSVTITTDAVTGSDSFSYHRAHAVLNSEVADPGETTGTSKGTLDIPPFGAATFWVAAEAGPICNR